MLSCDSPLLLMTEGYLDDIDLEEDSLIYDDPLLNDEQFRQPILTDRLASESYTEEEGDEETKDVEN